MDYYPFGMQLPYRNGTQPGTDLYRYGYQGQEADDEIKGEGNSYNYTYRMHDPRIGRFFAIDPLAAKYPHQSAYQFSSNQPIHTFELEGAESNMELGFQARITANIGTNGENTHFRGFLGISLTTGSGSTQGNFSLGLSGYTGGLGTTQGANPNQARVNRSGYIVNSAMQFNLELNASAGLNYGGGNGMADFSILTSNYYQGSGTLLENPYQNSGYAGLSGTLTLARSTQTFNDSKSRKQLSGYFGFRTGNFSLSNSNDLYSSSIIEDDSFWTGSFEAKYQFNETDNLALTYDCFTGKRPRFNKLGASQTHIVDGRTYYGGPGQQMHLYNNGQTTLKYTSNHVSFGIGHIGNGIMNGQWFQNAIHDNFAKLTFLNPKDKEIARFRNISQESLLIQVGGGL